MLFVWGVVFFFPFHHIELHSFHLPSNWTTTSNAKSIQGHGNESWSHRNKWRYCIRRDSRWDWKHAWPTAKSGFCSRALWCVVVRPPNACKGPFDRSPLAKTVESSKQRLPHPPFAQPTKNPKGSDTPLSGEARQGKKRLIYIETDFGARLNQAINTLITRAKVTQTQIFDNTGLPAHNTDTATILYHYEPFFGVKWDPGSRSLEKKTSTLHIFLQQTRNCQDVRKSLR